jgi:hypothetical protein
LVVMGAAAVAALALALVRHRAEGPLLAEGGRGGPNIIVTGTLFAVMKEEAHQPFQEIPDEWNARVDAFWREVDDTLMLGHGTETP